MSQLFHIHPQNPQLRLIDKTANILYREGVIIYPTDAAYAVGCLMSSRNAINRVRTISNMNKKSPLTLVCKDLSQLSQYARVNNTCYRLLKAATPGPYTFILPAAKQAPRQVLNPKEKTISLRIPSHNIVSHLLSELGEPLLSATLKEEINDDIEEIRGISVANELKEKYGHQIDLIIDGGCSGVEPTSVIKLIDAPQVIRQGKGNITAFFA